MHKNRKVINLLNVSITSPLQDGPILHTIILRWCLEVQASKYHIYAAVNFSLKMGS